MESQRLAWEHQQLRALLEQYSDAATDLPNLKAEVSLGWIRQVQEWLQEVMRLLLAWFKGLFGPRANAAWQIDWSLVSQILLWLCVAVLVCWLIISLAKKYLSHNRVPVPAGQLPTRMTSAEEPLQHSLDAAVNIANWGLAARLRWRLFLSRMHYQPHVTPDEFFREPSYQQDWEQLHGASVSEQYRMMFAAPHGARLWFDHYHESLTRLEGTRRHA
jgi:hypothetical protein